MRSLRISSIIAGFVGLALLGGACSDSSSPTATGGAVMRETPQRGETLRFALTHDPNGLDPTRNAWEASGTQVAVAVFDTLTATAADGSVRPYLAESLVPNGDYTQWTLKLRPGVTFHDGEPVNAAAMAKYTAAIKASLVTGQAAVNVNTAVPIDDLTLLFTMHRPWAAFPWILTGQAGAIASPKQLDDPMGQTRPAGAGPFKLFRWDIGSELELVRNENYWRKDFEGNQLPYLDGVTFKIMEDRLSRQDALQAGSIDLTHDRNVDAVRDYDQLLTRRRAPSPARGSGGADVGGEETVEETRSS